MLRGTARARGPSTVLILIILGLAVGCTSAFASAESGEMHEMGSRLPLGSILPFLGILLSIAFFPLLAPHWWHRHFPKVSLFWALVFAVPALYAYRGEALYEILHVYLLEYIPFIALLWALFTIAGGLLLKGTLRGTPMSNTVLLAIGTLLASWVGTTGASMIMIRPVLRANKWRSSQVHVIILFIFLVSNIGGALTPLGDPPLFLGFLLGVPFFWTLNLIPHMLFVALPLLLIFYIIDRRLIRGQKPPVVKAEPLRVEGLHNFLLLFGVVGMVFLSGIWHPGTVTVYGIHIAIESLVRDATLVLLGIVSLKTTNKEIHAGNGFSWFPIKEVAILFAGIFMTIISPLLILQAGSEGAFAGLLEALNSPVHYFWVTGFLSSFLDNAPSYLTLFSSVLGNFFAHLPANEGVRAVVTEKAVYLECISLGAVFFGALTYLGNAPNFMVRSIAEESGIRMPSFFGYMLKYSIPLLLPLFVLLSLVFF